MENKITPEFIEKVRQAKNTEEFIAIVKENGIEIPEDKANALFEKLKSVLSDEELGGVAAGDGEIPFDYDDLISRREREIVEGMRRILKRKYY